MFQDSHAAHNELLKDFLLQVKRHKQEVHDLFCQLSKQSLDVKHFLNLI